MSKSIVREIAELRDMTTEALTARYVELHGKQPHIRHREWLWKRIAWKIQERRHGGLSAVAQRRLEELIAGLDLPTDEQTRAVTGKMKPADKKDPAVGQTLVRHWRGRDIEVKVLADGVEYEGERFRSLSAVARHVTGSKWNGKLFFGVTKRKAAR